MRRPNGNLRAALLIAGIAACLCLSYGAAVLGEPSSAWLWGLKQCR